MEKVQNPQEYLKDLISEIDKAKKSILLQTMNFEIGEIVGLIEKHLIKAAKRGIEVRVNYDWVAKKYVHGDLQMFPTLSKEKRDYINKLQRKNERMYLRLAQAGVKLTRTNDPSFPINHMPYLGRSHIKMAVIDDRICWAGGVNLYDGAFENIDVMVKSDKPSLVSALTSQFYQINENKNPDDYKVVIDEDEALFVDVGRKGKSIILDRAKERIRTAKTSIIFMSQFVPDSKLLKEITEASERDVKTVILTSPPDNPLFTHYPEKLSYVVLKNTIEENKNIKLIHLRNTVHAKILFIDEEVILYGSHNYSFTGVIFGTAEIMVETHDKKMVEEFKDFMEMSTSENVKDWLGV